MSVTAGIFYDVSAHLCPAPVTDHKVEGGGVLGVDDGAVEADGAPTRVGHLSLVPDTREVTHNPETDTGNWTQIHIMSLMIRINNIS